MIGLVRHIEYLLLHNDRVVVPGLGCFAVVYCEARFLSGGTSLLPPVRSVAFEESGETGSELLLQSVMRAGFMTRDEALAAITDEVKSIRENLEQGNDYLLGRLGRLVWNEGRVEFRLADDNLLEYPRFGFAPVEIIPREEEPVEVGNPVEETAQRADRIYISFPRRVVRAAAVAAAVIVFLLMLSKPINTPDTTVNYAGILSAELLGKTTQPTGGQAIDEAEATEWGVTDLSVGETAVQGIAAPVEQPETLQSTTEPKPYYIIVASLPSRKLAEKQIECFRQQGVSSQLHIYETPRKARLYIASFDDFQEACQYRARLVKEQPLFANAWIMNAED